MAALTTAEDSFAIWEHLISPKKLNHDPFKLKKTVFQHRQTKVSRPLVYITRKTTSAGAQSSQAGTVEMFQTCATALC